MWISLRGRQVRWKGAIETFSSTQKKLQKMVVSRCSGWSLEAAQVTDVVDLGSSAAGSQRSRPKSRVAVAFLLVGSTALDVRFEESQWK